MKVNQTATGIFVDDKEVIAIELSNGKGTYVKLFNYGTIINKFVVTNAQGNEQDIVLGFDSFSSYISEDYLSNYPYFGAVIGRYANRIKDAKYTLDGLTYTLPKTNGEDCLHGGVNGFDKKVWDIIAISQAPQPSVTFQYYSLDGEEGFPGDLVVQLKFTLTENNELILTYQADTDEATPINLTHHSYFNLAANGDNISHHIHQINASNWLAQDDNYVVTGQLVPVVNSHYDFTTAKPISQGWDDSHGYDQTYVLDKVNGDLTLASKTSEKSSGLTLSIYTTEPVAHFYTAKYLDVKHGKGGKHYQAFDGFCIETQHHPNGINLANVPSTILRPNETYHQTTIYKIELS